MPASRCPNPKCGAPVRTTDQKFCEECGCNFAEWEAKTRAEQQERERAQAERKKTRAEWEKAQAEREKARAEQERAQKERETTQAQWEKAQAEKRRAEEQRLADEIAADPDVQAMR